MLEEQIRQGFSPLLAVLTSDAVERIAAKNNLSFTDLLLPFATVNCTVKDPSGVSVTSRVFFDFRDLRRDGFLLSLTVLPSVLHEAVSSVASTSDSEPVLASSAFSEALLKWSEPAEHEFLRTYIGCLFVVSTEDGDPVEELSKLIALQYEQQFGQNATPIGPAHCVLPRWMLPSIFKYFLLLDDEASNCGQSKVSAVFSSMCTKYGAQNCYLLKINSKYDDGLTDPWRAHLESKYRGLEKGLVLAKQKVLSKTVGLIDGTVAATGASLLQMNSMYANSNHANSGSGTGTLHGQCLSYDDRENVTSMMECMVRNALIPFVEGQMRTLNEQVIARRGISKSLTTGVRKWFGAAAAQQTASVSYSFDSGEMQIRRLADICFIFGLYSFAYQLYQSVRKEFAVDQAWLYNAGALEMAALSSFLSSPQITAKQYPQHYMDDAINFYATVSLRPILAMRAVLLSALMLSSLELYIEACAQLLRLTSFDDDLFSGVLLERASAYFGSANMRRKMAFHYVLAGHRMSKAGQKQLSMECYKRALPEYFSKRWVFAEDHILYTLANESEQKEEALSWCLPLIRPKSVQHAEQQRLFLKHYLWLLKQRNSTKKHALITVPLVDVQNISVIYGEQPVELTHELYANMESLGNNEDSWIDLEKAAYFVLTGSFAGFRETRAVCNASTKNSKVPVTPPLERIRTTLSLKNSMDIPLLLKNIHLEVTADPMLYTQSFIDEFSLEANCDWVPFEFSIMPKENLDEIRVNSLLFELVVDDISVACTIPLIIHGPRLHSTKKEKTSVLYGEDYRLCPKVTELRWPLVKIDLPPKRQIVAFCGQICRFDCDITNVGPVPLQKFCIATDHPELISVYEEENSISASFRNISFTSTPVNSSIGVFSLENGGLALGQRKRIRMGIRAPGTESLGYRIMLICYYRSDNGMVREQRHMIFIDTRVILESSLRLVDASSGACALQLRNLIPNRNSLLAKVELLRIRPVVDYADKCAVYKARQDPLPKIFLHPLQNRQVILDCGQTDCISFLASGHAGIVPLWLCDKVEDIPEWPGPPQCSATVSSAIPPSVPQTADENSVILELSLCFGVLWRANIVNSDGTVSTVFGENFISSPFPSGCSVPYCEHHIFRPLIIQQPFENVPESRRRSVVTSELGENSFAFICKISTPSPVIYHNFSEKRTCQIPVQIVITNDDVRNRRNCSVIVQFVDSFLVRKQPPADLGTLGAPGILPQLTSTSSSSPHLHSASMVQPVVVADRSRTRATIAFGCAHIFDIRLSVYCSSVYDIGRFRAVGQFDGDLTEVPIRVPCAYVTVIDSQRV